MSTRQSLDVPGVYDEQVSVPAHAAATATEIVPIFEAPAKVKINKVIFRPGAAVAGADTNTTHLNVIDMGVAGAGTTEKSTLELTNGVNLAAGERKELYAPAAGLSLEAGNLLGLQFEKVGTGLAIPAGGVIVEYEPN